jgi:hypothetical protein
MKPTNELFLLIKSLTKSEKRYFKLYSSLQEGDKNYLKLFDTIEKQKEYDEEEVKEKLRHESFIKHFPSEKNHLYGQILKSLRIYHAESSAGNLLKELIKDIKNLYNKGLYKEANKAANRARKVAYQYEKYYYLIEIMAWEKQLANEEHIFGDIEKNLDMLNNEEADILGKIKNLANFQMLYSKINYVFRKGGFSRTEKEKEIVEDVSNHPLIINKNTALSVRAKTMCYFIKGLCALTVSDLNEAAENFKIVLAIISKNEILGKDLTDRCILTNKFLLMVYIRQGDFENVFKLTKNMRTMSENPEYRTVDLRMKILTITSNAEIWSYIRMGDFQKGTQSIEEAISTFEEFSGKLNKEEEIISFYNIAYLYFGADEHKKALVWINKLLNEKQVNIRQDIYSFARIFNLVIHFELGNNDILEYLTKSAHRYHLKHNRNYKFESLIFKYFKKLARQNKPLKQKETLMELKSELRVILKDANEKVVLQYFDFISWLDSRIEGKKFADVIRQRKDLFQSQIKNVV